MPNYVKNRIRLVGEQADIDRLLEAVKFGGKPIGTLDFNKVIPMPESLKATPHKARLTALHTSCSHLFRHLAQLSLDRRQPACAQFVQSNEKSDCAIRAQSLCGIALISKAEAASMTR